MTHLGVILSNAVDKNLFIESILCHESQGYLKRFNGQKGVLFSDLAIEKLIEKEDRHHTIEILRSENRQLKTFSSGERRKMLLDYCLDQHPDFIVFDNPFDHLDYQSREALTLQMHELSPQMSIIQLAHCEESLLSFINHKIYLYDNSLKIHNAPATISKPVNATLVGFPSALLRFDRAFNIIVEFNEVNVTYEDQPIVKDITWQVKQGEFWQLIGPNGSGKSTLLSLITGENPKAYGQNIIIFDRQKGSGESIWDIKRKIGHFSTNVTELFKRHQTVEQMILSGFFDSVGLYRKPSGLQLKTLVQWLEVIGMLHLRNYTFNKLSTGQQRLILIVRALIKQPPLLILDEPFEGLDQENAQLVAQLLNTLIETTEITLIYVSHTIENTLVPSHIFELIPTAEGSMGKVLQ